MEARASNCNSSDARRVFCLALVALCARLQSGTLQSDSPLPGVLLWFERVESAQPSGALTRFLGALLAALLPGPGLPARS